MDPIVLARVQFALTAGFHFLFPPLTIGLAWLIVWLMGRYKASGAEADRRLARFWIKIFALSFAVGVATGIVLEFQFGTNWATYSRFVGDIFGAPLAAEAVLSFFLESVFLGVLLFGWSRLSRRQHWFASVMVAVGSTLSAFWIIVADSWMQTPAAFVVRNGRAELTDFAAAVFNPSTLPRYCHTLDGALLTGAFFMLGISAWYLLRERYVVEMRRGFTTALVLGFLAALGALGLGHWHAVQVANTQPAKLAAFEGLFKTQANAPLLLFGIPDAAQRTVHLAVTLPSGLSILAHLDPNAVVTGLDQIPRDEWPPLLPAFFPFHLMVLLGCYFIAFTGLGMLLLWTKRLFTTRLFLQAAVWSIPLPFIATNVGWMAAEIGRQPWIVWHLLRTRDAVSVTVPAWQVLASILMFTTIYAVLLYTWVRLLRHEVRQGLDEPAVQTSAEVTA